MVLGGCDLFANATDYHNSIVEINNPISSVASQVEKLVEDQTTKAITTKTFDKAGYDAAAASIVTTIDTALTKMKALKGFKGDESLKNEFVKSLEADKELITKSIPEMIEKVAGANADEAKITEIINEFAEKADVIDDAEEKAVNALKAFDAANNVKVR